jgi:hypothetical protein
MAKSDDAVDRNERLAKALRANLARRKAQSRAKALARAASDVGGRGEARPSTHDAEKPHGEEG